jgi:hypothetical protein
MSGIVNYTRNSATVPVPRSQIFIPDQRMHHPLGMRANPNRPLNILVFTEFDLRQIASGKPSDQSCQIPRGVRT